MVIYSKIASPEPISLYDTLQRVADLSHVPFPTQRFLAGDMVSLILDIVHVSFNCHRGISNYQTSVINRFPIE